MPGEEEEEVEATGAPLLLLGKRQKEGTAVHPRSEGDKRLSGKVSLSDKRAEGESRASPREIRPRRNIQRKTLISAFDKKGIESLFPSQPPTGGKCRRMVHSKSHNTQAGIGPPCPSLTPQTRRLL